MADERHDVSLRSKHRRQGFSTGHEVRNAGQRDRSQASGRHGRPSQESVRSTETKSRPRLRADDSTTNMVRKRYSVRYGQQPDMSQAPPVPGLPPVPAIYAQQNGSNASLGQNRGGLDIRALRDPNLQPDQYLAEYLATASEQQLAEYQQQLRSVKNRASTDWQRNVSQNRTQFIKISKEAEKLKGEMQTLQGLMNDLSIILDQATTTSGGANRDDSVRKRANRSSVANLEAMWSTQLQSLWKLIEGSQKFVAAIPGRHVILEQQGWTELDSATWKPKRPAHLVLLNDNLLVALRKRKRMDPSLTEKGLKAPTKIVAERCFSLQDVDLIDLETSVADSRSTHRQPVQISGAITIRHGQESFTYKADNPKSSQKNDLVVAFRLAVEGLRRSERAETVVEKPTASSYITGRSSTAMQLPSVTNLTAKAKDKPEVLIDVDGKQRNMRWVDSQVDELDIEVALQRFEEAVAHVEFLRGVTRGMKHNALAQEIVTNKVNERVSKLADVLTALLTTNAAQLSATQIYVGYLTRLDLIAAARVTYLAARTAQVHARIRSIVFEGNILSHITALSFVYFTLIRNTISVYQQCFPQPMMSACITWGKGQLDAYNEQLQRALSGVEKGSDVYRQGLARARELASTMDEVGLDFGVLVGVGLDA